MDFVKMEGLGNDFVVVEGPKPSVEDIRRWCDRRTGIGADGVLRISAPSNGVATLRMQYWNPDGSVAEMCGNGMRCVARYAYERGLTDDSSFTIETAVGVNRAEIRPDGQVRVELAAFVVNERVEIEGVGYHPVTVGNPHAVTFVDDPATAPVRSVGPQVEHNEAFPDDVNVEFVVVEAESLRMRVWERGVGETRACGTGAAAAVAVATSLGMSDGVAQVDLLGGRLLVELVDGVAWITGPANTVFTGQLFTGQFST